MSQAFILQEARAHASDPVLVDVLFLVKHGIPFDVAFSLSPTRRLAWVVVMGELSGGKFDWSRGEWVTKE